MSWRSGFLAGIDRQRRGRLSDDMNHWSPTLRGCLRPEALQQVGGDQRGNAQSSSAVPVQFAFAADTERIPAVVTRTTK